MTFVVLMVTCLAILLITQFFLLRRAEDSLRREARAEADRAELVTFIQRYTSSIGSSHDIHEWMTQVAGFVLHALDAQAVCIYLLETEVARRIACRGVLPAPDPDTSPQTRRLLEQFGRERIELAGEFGLCSEIFGPVSFVKENFNAQYGAGPIRSFISTPMRIDREPLGVICALNRTGATPQYTAADAFLLESMASQIALGITFVEVYAALGEQSRLEQELELAKGIQESLLPQDPPEHQNYRIHAAVRPAREVSGDFYDFIQLTDDLLLAVVADASGKGIPACIMMAMCRTLLRSNAIRYQDDLEGLMREVNHNLFLDTDATQFVTMACLLIDRRDHTVEYVRAGHPALLMRLPDDRIVTIAPEGPALGLMPDTASPIFDTFAFTWDPGVSLLLFTDGLTEALSESDELYGLDRLLKGWQRQGREPVAAATGIFDEVLAFAGQRPQGDDQTVMILHRPGNGDATAGQSLAGPTEGVSA